jgi:3-deoxy-manno-octulosonate cytidylyltransferase (CMP-KDO synthetase)
MTAPVLGVIPARLGSTRLPRKPLHPLAGRPLLEWVWRRVVELGALERVVVATDHPDVERVARAFGAEVVLTRPEHPSGTDRVAEVARRPEYRDFPLILNLQGDEPFLRRAHLDAALSLLRSGWEVGTVATPITSAEEWRDPAVVKVLRGDDGAALCFTRAAAPHPRDGEPDFASGAYLRHLGIYGYTRDALLRWVALPEGALERIERLEQLRPLAAGVRIGVAVGEPAEGGVDTPADAARAERTLLLHSAATPPLERACP